MNETDIFDYTEENKPQKPPMSKKTKKKLIYALCVLLGIGVALLGIYIFSLITSGAKSPEKAVAEYVKAHNLYDIDGIIEYSSEANKKTLYSNRNTNDKLLRDYLKKAYEGQSPKYSENQIYVELVSVIEYSSDTNTFKEHIAEYEKKVGEGSGEEITETAVVRMRVTTGDLVSTQNYIAIKIGSRWYYNGTD